MKQTTKRKKHSALYAAAAAFSPVNYFVLMEELQAEQHARRVEPGTKTVEILTGFGDTLKVSGDSRKEANCIGLREGGGASALLTGSVCG